MTTPSLIQRYTPDNCPRVVPWIVLADPPPPQQRCERCYGVAIETNYWYQIVRPCIVDLSNYWRRCSWSGFPDSVLRKESGMYFHSTNHTRDRLQFVAVPGHERQLAIFEQHLFLYWCLFAKTEREDAATQALKLYEMVGLQWPPQLRLLSPECD